MVNRKKQKQFYTRGKKLHSGAVTACLVIRLAACAVCGVFAVRGMMLGIYGALPTLGAAVAALAAALFTLSRTAAAEILSLTISLIAAAAGITAYFLAGEPMYGICGGIMLFAAAAACVSLRLCEKRSTDYSAEQSEIVGYTLLRSLSDENTPAVPENTAPENQLPAEPPKQMSEMRELADKLETILRN